GHDDATLRQQGLMERLDDVRDESGTLALDQQVSEVASLRSCILQDNVDRLLLVGALHARVLQKGRKLLISRHLAQRFEIPFPDVEALVLPSDLDNRLNVAFRCSACHRSLPVLSRNLPGTTVPYH